MTEALKAILKKVGAVEVHHVADLDKPSLNEVLKNSKNEQVKIKKAKVPKAPRGKSGEMVLIELMTSNKWHTQEELVNETGLAASSIKMYCNGYLERVRHKPYHIVEANLSSGIKYKLEKIDEQK